MWEKPWFKWTVVGIVVVLLILALIMATLKEPEVQSATVTDIRRGSGTVDVYVTLDVKNPNIIGGTLKEVDAVAYLDGERIGPVSLEKEADVPAMKTSQVDVILHVDSLAIGTNWDAAGSVTVEVLGMTFEVPFDTR